MPALIKYRGKGIDSPIVSNLPAFGPSAVTNNHTNNQIEIKYKPCYNKSQSPNCL